MNRFTKPLLHLAALLLFIGLTADTAKAQNYAAPGGIAYAADGDCSDPNNPCNLGGAVEDATDGGASGTTIFFRLNNSGTPTAFEEDLTNGAIFQMIDADVTFDTFRQTPFATGAAGQINIDGDVTVDANVNVELLANVTMNLIGQPGVLELRANSSFTGDGVLLFGANTGTHTVRLGTPAACPDPAVTVSLHNVQVNKIGGTVNVIDGCTTDNNRSELFITNRLDVSNGLLNLNDNALWITSDNTMDAGVSIGSGAEIRGDGKLFLAVQPFAAGGFPNVRPDTDADPFDDCFVVSGTGFLNMAFDKVTDAGVCVELSEIGAGGTSFNRAGTLFVTQATTHNGNFRNEGVARTEFDKLTSITSNLEATGPGGETNPSGVWTVGCDPAIHQGNDSGVYFFDVVTVEGSVLLSDTNAPGLACRTQGLFFLADKLAQDVVGISLFKGIFTNDFSSGVYLGHDAVDNAFHNLQLDGQVSFGQSPVFDLQTPAVAFSDTDLCGPYTVEARGNKVIFGGGLSPQNLIYSTPLDIASVQIKKNASAQNVVIDAASSTFLIETSLEVIRGNFVTNGLLDANAGPAAADGATVVINWDATGFGVLLAGSAARAYIDDNVSNTPRKIKYTGSVGIFTGAEIPGTTAGSVGQPEVSVSEIEVALNSDAPVVTLGKSVTVSQELRLTQGNLDVGSATLRLGNQSLVAIGNGEIRRSGTPPFFGNLEFPTEFIDPFEVGEDGIDLLYFGTTDRTVGLGWPPASTTVANRKADADVIRDVTLDSACNVDFTITLRGDDDSYRINRDLEIFDGTLDINGNVLEINAVNGNNSIVHVHTAGDLHDLTDTPAADLKVVREQLDAFKAALLRTGGETVVRAPAGLIQALDALAAARAAAKAQAHAGLLKFIGANNTDVKVFTTTAKLLFDFPAIEVDRTGGSTGGKVTFDANGVLATTLDPIPANNIDVLRTSHFTLTDADNEDGVRLLAGLDLLDIEGDYTQLDGGFLMAGVSSVGAAPTQPAIQKVSTGGDFIEDNGWFWTSGGDVDVFGDFSLGANLGQDPGDALFSLSAAGVHTVVGDFTVGPDTNPDERAVDADEDGDTVFQPEERNRYFLGNGQLVLFGDYTFEGTGDLFDDDAIQLAHQGLRGAVFFVGAQQQEVLHRQDEDAFFNHVVLSGEGGILLRDDGWQNQTGVLRLLLGIVDTDDNQWDWIILNPGFETNLVGRNTSAACADRDNFGCFGVVELGTRDSYVNGAVQRVVVSGNATGGLITGGYLFPVGTEGDPRSPGDVDFFRPLILQFADDLGRTSVARVDYLTPDELPAGLDLPANGLQVNDVGGQNLTLDVVGDLFWKLEFDRIPSQDPNIRVEAAGLPNIFDITKLRLIQWDCDGSNPRLAGLYDLDVDPTDDPSAVLNDFINGVPNLTQEGIAVDECNIIGIASNAAINAIDVPQFQGGVASIQALQCGIGADVDVTFGGRTFSLSDQQGTRFIATPAGSFDVDFTGGVEGSTTLNTVADDNVVVVALSDGTVAVVPNARLDALNPSNVEFVIVHGAEGAGTVDLRTLDPLNNNEVSGILANNLALGGVTAYQQLAPGIVNVEVTSGDGSQQLGVYQFDLSGMQGQTFTLLICEDGSLIGFDIFGNPIVPQVVTATEGTDEVPAEFALGGNYPNPFNPTTNILVDLPQTAEVSVAIFDMLGRQVMEVPAKMMEAGTKRSIEVNAVNLASGTYIYRVTAKTATDAMVKTGRMTLVK